MRCQTHWPRLATADAERAHGSRGGSTQLPSMRRSAVGWQQQHAHKIGLPSEPARSAPAAVLRACLPQVCCSSGPCLSSRLCGRDKRGGEGERGRRCCCSRASSPAAAAAARPQISKVLAVRCPPGRVLAGVCWWLEGRTGACSPGCRPEPPPDLHLVPPSHLRPLKFFSRRPFRFAAALPSVPACCCILSHVVRRGV